MSSEKPFSIADVVLRDGSVVRVRLATREDLDVVSRFLESLSSETLYKRFMGFARPSAEALLPEGDGRALLAFRSGAPVGHAVYRRSGGKAEVGVVVADGEQGKGLGTILVGMISELAYRDGVEEMEASVLPENVVMLQVLKSLGFPYRVEVGPGVITASYSTSKLGEAAEVFDRREAEAVRSSLKPILEPASVVVIGASRFSGTVGGALFRNIIEGNFSGVCYPVNKNSKVVQSVAAYPSIKDVPDKVDLAVVAVPAQSVLDVAKQCVEKGVGALVVISSGFAEAGEDGRRLQQELLTLCRESGIRLVGPNCMGVINTDPKVSLNAQFSPQSPLRGSLGFLSQSGALGIAVIDYTRRLGLGLSSFVSVGNKADISGNDLLEYWEEDGRTQVILLYLESFGNPRKFARIARRVSKKKPIVAVKAGRSSAGLRATQSHTGAMLSGSNVAVDALFRQAGVIRVDTLSELFDVAALLATQPLPKGDGVGIITNAGGAGILAADACEAGGLKVVELQRQTQDKLREFLLPIASTRNPVDMSAEATPEHYYRTIKCLAEDPPISSLLIIFVPPLTINEEDVAKSILKGVQEAGRSITTLSVFLGRRGIPELLKGDSISLPSYSFPEEAALALSRATRYAKWRNMPPSPYARPSGTDHPKAVALVSKALARAEGWLEAEEAYRLLELYGIPLAKTLFAATPTEAGELAAKVGGKVVLKADSKGLVHKTEAGAVKLSLDPESVESEARAMAERLDRIGVKVERYVVQEMVSGGVELLVGVTQDPNFGPVVACGFGGTLTELVRDVNVALTPLTERDVDELVERLKLYPILVGHRGGATYDVQALKDVVARVGALVEDIPSVLEMDINPLIVLEKGVKAVDVRVRVGRAGPYVPLSAKSAA